MSSESKIDADLSAADPLLIKVDLPYSAIYFPYGFPFRVETNSSEVIRAAHANWAGMNQLFSELPVLTRVVVSEGTGRECPPRPVYRAQRHLLSITADAENHACCDLEYGFGAAWISQAALQETDYFRYHFLLGMAGSMMEMLHLASVHAACVALDGSGILLAGESGAGKSSLSFACAKRGFTYLNDDCSSIVRSRNTRSVIGMSNTIRFRESAGELFSEVFGRKPAPRAGRDPSIELRTSEMPGIQTAYETMVDHIVFLDRRPEYGNAADLAPMSIDEARRRLFLDVWPTDLPAVDARREAVDRLFTAGLFTLKYRDLDPAVDRLEMLIRRGL